MVLDRELHSSYQLLITCTDAVGTNLTSLTGSAGLSVFVDDINDHAPVFRSRVYLVHVAENQPIGTSVAVIEAVDRDDGHNADVRYRLLTKSGGDFRLDMRSGLLTTNRNFDREREEVINVTVVAMDLGNPSLSSTADVIVSILDVDDEVNLLLITFDAPLTEKDKQLLWSGAKRSIFSNTALDQCIAVSRFLQPVQYFRF